jgi:isopenicillin-N N-acyltransferase-like protein
MTDIRIIKVAGLPYEMGFQYGSSCRELIQRFIGVHYEILLYRSAEEARTFLQKQDVRELASQFIPYLKANFSSIWEEMKGIAKGAQCEIEDIVAVNCFCDFQDFFWPRLAGERLYGCTTFAVAPFRSTTGKCLTGQTFDLPSMFEDYGILLFGKPSGGPTFACYTLAGVVCCVGMSENGVAVVINRLTASDGQPGIPFPVIAHSILQAPNTSKALDNVLRSRRASGLMYIITDGDGNIFPVETTATDYTLLEVREGLIIHTNHYVSGELQKAASYHKPFAANTIARLYRAYNFLRMKDKIGQDELIGIMSDHLNYPTSICRHSDESIDPRLQDKTIAAFIAHPGERKILICRGNPCCGEFAEFTLDQ